MSSKNGQFHWLSSTYNMPDSDINLFPISDNVLKFSPNSRGVGYNLFQKGYSCPGGVLLPNILSIQRIPETRGRFFIVANIFLAMLGI